MRRIAITLSIVLLAGCATERQARTTTTGAAIGATAGAAIGAQNHQAFEGALIGGMIGAAAGAAMSAPDYQPVYREAPRAHRHHVVRDAEREHRRERSDRYRYREED